MLRLLPAILILAGCASRPQLHEIEEQYPLGDKWLILAPDIGERVPAWRERIIAAATGIVDPARVVATGTGPIINLAILDRHGAGAPIGRGIFIAPPALFTTGD